MKKLFSILGSVLLAVVFIFFLTAELRVNKNAVAPEVDLSESQTRSEWNTSTKKFQEITQNATARSGIYYQKFSPIDGIYYQSTIPNPIRIQKNASGTLLTFGTGIFICDMEDATVHYTIQLDNLTLVPRERGVFLIDTTQKETVVFSYNTFLDIELSSGKHTPVTNFVLFPSLLFRYDPANNAELR